MPRNADDTRARLIRAAERLLAERGVHSVSLREINREAGQRNATALQYHFHDRAGLIQAILRKHAAGVDENRMRRLDDLEAKGGRSLHRFAAALVLPESEKLSGRDGGRDYLRIVAQLVNSHRPPVDPIEEIYSSESLARWRKLVEPQMSPVAVYPLHSRFTALRIMFVELARRAEMSRRRDDRLFSNHLIDMIAAILGAPISRETRTLLNERTDR